MADEKGLQIKSKKRILYSTVKGYETSFKGHFMSHSTKETLEKCKESYCQFHLTRRLVKFVVWGGSALVSPVFFFILGLNCLPDSKVSSYYSCLQTNQRWLVYLTGVLAATASHRIQLHKSDG
jgi:hypothetical protein